MIKLICNYFEGGITMAKNISNKKTNYANNRPNCLKVTKKAQKVNLQQVKITDKNGNTIKVRLSAREIKALKNAA
mgnify:CR=1 FL=1